MADSPKPPSDAADSAATLDTAFLVARQPNGKWVFLVEVGGLPMRVKATVHDVRAGTHIINADLNAAIAAGEVVNLQMARLKQLQSGLTGPDGKVIIP